MSNLHPKTAGCTLILAIYSKMTHPENFRFPYLIESAVAVRKLETCFSLTMYQTPFLQLEHIQFCVLNWLLKCAIVLLKNRNIMNLLKKSSTLERKKNLTKVKPVKMQKLGQKNKSYQYMISPDEALYT